MRVIAPATRTMTKKSSSTATMPDGAAVTGEPAQRVGQRVDVAEHVVDELLDLPDALFAIGGQGEVDAVDRLDHALTLRSASRPPSVAFKSGRRPRVGQPL